MQTPRRLSFRQAHVTRMGRTKRLGSSAQSGDGMAVRGFHVFAPS